MGVNVRRLVERFPFFAASIVCLVLGIFFPWFLVASFVFVFHTLYEYFQIINSQRPNAIQGNESSQVQSSTLNSRTRASSTSHSSNVGASVVSPDAGSSAAMQSSSTSAERTNNRRKAEPWGIPTLRIRDPTGHVLMINPDEPVPYESEYFKGIILIMMRADDSKWETHFAGKQRKFEVQIQGKIKKNPGSNFMMAAELSEKVEFGLVTRTMVNLMLRFCGKLVANLQYSLGDEYSADGLYELPHMAFPLFRTMDRVVVTPPGMTPPELGKELPESEAERNARRGYKTSGENLKFEFENTYSFSFHSMYIDFANWTICNVPGYKTVDIKSILGNKSVNVVVYDIPNPSDGKSFSSLRHFACNKNYVFQLEFSHISIMSEEELNENNNVMNTNDEEVELEATVDSNANSQSGNQLVSNNHGVEGAHISSDEVQNDRIRANSQGESPSEGYAGDRPSVTRHREESSGTDNDDEALSEVPSNTFVPITLQHDDLLSMPSNSDRKPRSSNEQTVWPGIGGTNSFAVVRDFQDVQSLRFIKLSTDPSSSLRSNKRHSMMSWSSSSKKKTSIENDIAVSGKHNSHSSGLDDDKSTSDTFWKKQSVSRRKGDKLRNGDIVQVQSAKTGEYLVVQRGWWLVWTSREPHDKKGHFIITITDYDGGIKHGNLPLYVGFTFSLRSARWPTWQIGCQTSPSITYGGKLLTLFHTPKAAINGEKESDRTFSTVDGPTPSSAKQSVRPLIMCVLPDSVCERYSKETEGTIRAVMSLNAVFRNRMMQDHTNFQNRPQVGLNRPPHAHMYRNSSKISLPMDFNAGSSNFVARDDDSGGRVMSDLNAQFTEAGITNLKNNQKNPFDKDSLDNLSYRYFSRDVMSWQDLSGVLIEITGWVEVLNRSSNQLQIAYVMSCEVPDEYDPEDKSSAPAPVDDDRIVFTVSSDPHLGNSRARRFSVIRTGAQIFEALKSIIELQQKNSKKESDKQKESQSVTSNSSVPVLDVTNLSWASDEMLFGSQDTTLESPRRALISKTGDMESPTSRSLQNGKNGKHFGIICPRHQSAADHSFQLLSALIAQAQRKELINELPSLLNELSTANNSEMSNSSCVIPSSYPARRTLLKLAASRNDALSAFFISSSTQLFSSNARKNDTSLRRNSTSAADLKLFDSPLICSTIVARALWDFHWKEEYIQLHSTYISFFSLNNSSGDEKGPQSATNSGPAPATLMLLLIDVTSVSVISNDFSKLPGYYILRLETVGRVTYVAFTSAHSCRAFIGSVLEQKSAVLSSVYDASDIPSEVAVSDPRDSFVLRSGRWRPLTRMVLNSRRFLFDIEQQRIACLNKQLPFKRTLVLSYDRKGDIAESEFAVKGSATSQIPMLYWELSAKLLRDVSKLCDSTSNSNLNTEKYGIKTPSVIPMTDRGVVIDSDEAVLEAEGKIKFLGSDRLMSFLDEISSLKLIDLTKVDYYSPEAVCFFGNVYHTLLLHARLVLGFPVDESWSSFFDTVSYEIGGDVFLLAELEQCVLRGKLTRPVDMPKTGFKLPVVDDDRYSYALSGVDARINFFISTGSKSSTEFIFVLTPENLEKQLSEATRVSMEFGLNIDLAKRVIVLPSVCQLHRNDFLHDDVVDSDQNSKLGSGNVNLLVLEYCMKYMGKTEIDSVANLIPTKTQAGESSGLVVRYRPFEFKSYSTLVLKDDENVVEH